MQQSISLLGAHRQLRAAPDAGHNSCVPLTEWHTMACRRAAIADLSSGGSQSSDEHRSALLRHLDVVERIAAHFAQVSGRSVVICSEPPQQAKGSRRKIPPRTGQLEARSEGLRR